MKKGMVPSPGIDTDVLGGYSHTNEGWVVGYKPHLMSTIGDFVVPLAVDVTTANILNPDIRPLTYSSLVFSLPSILYMIADPTGYNDKKLYQV